MLEEKKEINSEIAKIEKRSLGLHNWLLITLVSINIMSILGYANFSLNPILLEKYPITAKIFNYSYYFFSRTQIIVAFFALVALLYKKYNYSWLKELGFVFAISLLLEGLGTTYGIPFGKYEYTDLLGWKFFDKVPLLIPISWFFMAIPSYAIAMKLTKIMALKNKFIIGFFNILLASVFLTSWDLTLDPAMSNLTPFWIWESKGSYFGTPIVNFGGWLLTSAIIMLGFEILNTKRLLDNYDLTWNLKFYLANLSLPIGLVICSGLWRPVVFTILVFLACYLLSIFISFFGQKELNKLEYEKT